MSLLEVTNLSKKFKNFWAVNNISFSIGKGEIVGFLGPNGAGKTTTIHMLLGVLTPTAGLIKYFGQEFNNKNREVLSQVNYASAYSDLPWRMTVWENLSFYAELYGVKDKKDRIAKLLKDFDALEFMNKTMSSLSAGQKTRIFLVKSFINFPEIVLLDEPTASLDVEIARGVRDFLKKQQREYGVSILLTSHNMKDVEELADRVIVINHGKIVDEDTPLNLMKKMNKTKLKFFVFENLDAAKATIFYFEKELQKNVAALWHKEQAEVDIEDELIPRFLAKLFENKVYIRDLEVVRPGLEEYFLTEIKKSR